MHKKWVGVIALGGIIASQPAGADWQYTKWGMTPDQVLSAAKGKMRRCSPESCKGQTTETDSAQIYGEHTAGEFSFTAYAMFNKRSNRLTSVSLKLWDPNQADSLIGSVRLKYGEPATKSQTAIMGLYVWRDAKDQISVLKIGQGDSASTSLQYQPRATEAGKGL